MDLLFVDLAASTVDTFLVTCCVRFGHPLQSIGIARGYDPQISSRSCRFVLWQAVSQT